MPTTLTAEQAIASAVAAAGSEDFGPAGWREGLDRSLDAFARLPLTEAASAAAHGKLVHDLATRLRIVQWHKDHPEAANQEIEGPVFVVGLPRTGTTATVAMLGLDERFRFLRAWEGGAPVPPPVAGEEHFDPRVIAAHEAAASYDKPHMHLFDPDGPEEDFVFFAPLDMKAYHGPYPVPEDYLEWWLSTDFTPTYAFHQRVLQMLQSRRPPHLWLLKSPPHLPRLDVIARQYPKAKFVMTHRDPRKVIGSVASLHHSFYEERCLPGAVDKLASGRRHLRVWEESVRRALRARDEIGEERFIDVYNEDVVAEPVGTFERIYAFLGMDIGADLRMRLTEYNQRNAPGAFGQHRYTLEEYGLSGEAVDAAFAEYLARFPRAISSRRSS